MFWRSNAFGNRTATNKVMTEEMYGDLAPEVQHEILKATQDLKPQIMESLYAVFGKTPAVVKKNKK